MIRSRTIFGRGTNHIDCYKYALATNNNVHGFHLNPSIMGWKQKAGGGDEVCNNYTMSVRRLSMCYSQTRPIHHSVHLKRTSNCVYFKSNTNSHSGLISHQLMLLHATAFVENSEEYTQGTDNSVRKNTKDTSLQDTSESKSLSQKDRIKVAVKEYGSTVFVFHITLALSWLGASYMLVSSGVDVVSVLNKLGFTEAFIQSKMGAVATGTSTFVVAYAFYKIFAPVRIAITLSVTPLLVRYLRNIGILKKRPIAK